MPRIIWNTLGLMSGLFARTFTGKHSRLGLDIAMGIIGAVIGSWLFSYFGTVGASELSQGNVLIDLIGAVALLCLFQALTSSTQ